jgi:hypothetical protein
MANARWFSTVAALLGIAIPSLWLFSLVTPGEEAVKVRNALVAEVGEPQDFLWTPAEPSPEFQFNQAAPTERYRAAAQALQASTDGGPPRQGLDLALAIARHLMGDPSRRQGGPIQSGMDETYDAIRAQRRGYCADFTQAFSGLAIAAGLPVRTWSISFEAFGAGHTFNEIYDQRPGKWILVDPFHSLYFVDPDSRVPLSVLDVHGRMLALDGETRGVEIQPIVKGGIPFRSEAMALEYYRRGMSQLAMFAGNNVFDYDQSPVVRAAASVSRHAERAAAIATGQYPSLLIYPEAVSYRDVSSLMRVRSRVLQATGALAIACLVFGGYLLSLWLGRKRDVPDRGRAIGS